MINVTNNLVETQTGWEYTLQPAYSNPQTVDTLQLLAAMREGWQITESANYLAHGLNAEGRGYMLTLYHPRLFQTREWNVMRNPEVDALLTFESVPGFTTRTG